MDIQQNNVAVLHFNLVNQDGSTIFIRKTKLATFNLINPSAVSVPITDIGFDATLNQCWVRVPKESNATTGQYYGVLNIVDDDWGTYTTSKIKVYSVVSDADEDTKSVVFTATCIATQVTNPSGGNSPYYNATTGTWWQYSDTLKAFEDTGVGNLIQYITKNVQHLKDGTGNGSIVTCLDDEISANNIATGLCSTDLGKNNDNGGESCVALGENNYIAEGVSNATAIAGAQPSIVDVFAVGDKTVGHKNVFVIDKFGNIHLRPDSSQERTAVLQDILDRVIKNVFYDSSKYSLTVTFYSAADNANKIKTYDLSGLKAVLKDDAVKEISVNQSTAVMTVNTINGSSQQIQLPATKLATARTIGLSGVTSTAQSFDGSANITIPITAVPATLLTGTASISTTGNAATATKLANARTINIAGASTGSVSFDGASDVTINTVRRSCSVGQSGGTTTNPWYKVASCNISDALVDMKITFQVNGWWSSDDMGILSIRVRSSGSKTYESSSIVWEVASNGIKLGDFVLAHNTGVTPAICELWVNIPFANYFYKFNVIEEGNRTANYNAWTLYDLNQAGYASAPTSGYTLQASTLATIKNNAATATKLATARSITLSGNTTGTATFDGSANITIDTSGSSSIQPFDLLDSNEQGTFWAQTSTNSIAVGFITDSKVTTNKVRISINSTEGAKIRCAIYKQESNELSLVTQTQLYTGQTLLAGVPFETVVTLDSDSLYFFVVGSSRNDSTFLGKRINADLMTGFLYQGDAFNAGFDTFKSQYPTDGHVTGNVFVPYFKII